ncbi:MAG TPA: 50S ribosomal protein L25 [Vicinamibacteria bacterium]|nr:50S ribosomal protein L25 [Vicinamibacteria bacterium]
MEKMVVEAERRVSFGKGANRKLRAKGMIPAVVYGQKKDSIPVAIDPKVLIRILRSHAGANTIFDLQVKGSDGTDNVMVKDYQLEPVEHELLHADLIRVAMDHALTLSVQIELSGIPVGVKLEGGLLDFVSRAIEVSCLPADIPEKIKVDVSGLVIGHLVRAGELELPERVTLVSDPGLVIAHVEAPKVEEEPAAEAVAAEGQPAEPEVIKKGKAEVDEGSKEGSSE